MIKRHEIFSLSLLLMLSLLSSCSFEHYSSPGSLRINARFPKSKNADMSVSKKPSDADETYVPSFIERISFSLSKDGVSIASAVNDRDADSGLISNEFEISQELEYGTYNVQAEAFICKTADCSQLHTTHKVDFDYELTASSESAIVPVMFEIQKGPIDDGFTVINVDEIASSSDTPPYRPYCLTLNEQGNFAFGWMDPTFGQQLTSGEIKFRVYDSKLFRINTNDNPGPPVFHDGLITDFNCIWQDDRIYLPVIRVGPSSAYYHLHLASYDPSTNTLTGGVNEIELTEDENKMIKSFPYIDIGHGAIALAWSTEGTSATETAYVLMLDAESGSKLYTTPASGFCHYEGIAYRCTYPKVKIIDEKTFVAFGLSNYRTAVSGYIGRLTGRKGMIIESGNFSSSSLKFLSAEYISPSGPYPDLYYDIVSDGKSNFSLTWQSHDNIEIPSIFATFINNEIGSYTPNLISGGVDPGVHASIAMKADNELYAAWVGYTTVGVHEYALLYRKLSSEGSPSSDIKIASESNLAVYAAPMSNPKIKINSDGFGIISWHSYSGGLSTIMFKRFMF